MDASRFFSTLHHSGITVDGHQSKSLELFHTLITQYNQAINLISRQETDVWTRHFLNCACVAKFLDLNDQSILDVGSGGGFPALILAILFPRSTVVLTESIQKKASALRDIIHRLEIGNATVVANRVERMEPGAQFDWITARAVAKIDEIIRWSRPHLKLSGSFLLWKGRRYRDELSTRLLKNCRVYDLSEVDSSQDGVLLRIQNK